METLETKELKRYNFFKYEISDGYLGDNYEWIISDYGHPIFFD